MILDLTTASSIPKIYDKLLENIFENSKKQFNEIISNLNNINLNNKDWLFSLTFSRNTLNSNFYLEYCYLIFIKKLIDTNVYIDSIVVDSDSLELSIKKNFSFLKTININNKNFLTKYKKTFNKFIFFIYQLIYRIYQYVVANIFFNKIDNANKYIIIENFIFPNNLSKDRYFGDLSHFLEKFKSINVLYFPTITYTDISKLFSTYKKLKNLKNKKFLIKDKYIKIFDIIFSIFYIYRVVKINYRSTCKYHNLILDDMIFEELYSLKSINISIEAYINYFFIKRLKQNHVNILLFIDWWENQSIDKGISLGINLYYNNIRHIGYLGYSPRKSELQLSPTIDEYKSNVLPNEIAIIGLTYKNFINKFYSNLQIKISPAFRYDYLWSIKRSNVNANKINIIIALPILENDSIFVLDIFYNFYVNLLKKEIISSILVKPHPVTHHILIKLIKDRLKDIKYKIISENLSNYFSNVDLIVTSNSIVALESIFLDIPVINLYNKSKLNFSSIPSSLLSKNLFNVTNTEEFNNSFSDIVNMNKNSSFDKLKNKHEYFCKVNQDSFNYFIGLK